MVNQVRLCGYGGQGIVLAGVILGHAGVLDGKYAAQSSSYGAEARGSACKSEVVISDEWIDFPHVLKTDTLIAMSQPAYDKYCCDVVGEGGVIFHDEELVKPNAQIGVSHFPIPATQRALEVFDNRLVANTVLLASVVEATGIVSPLSLKVALEQNIGEKHVEINKKALDLGFDLGSKLKKH